MFVSELMSEEAKKKIEESPFSLSGYFRVMGRYDFGHNGNTLGWWPLYGRLLNETPWLTLEMKYKVNQPAFATDFYSALVMRVEGGSFRNTDNGMGKLDNLAITQMYYETNNFPFKNIVTQTGTLWYNMGYIGIFDMYVSQVFWETVGFRMGQRFSKLEYFIGAGDSGYHYQKERKNSGNNFEDVGYNAVPTIGAMIKYNPWRSLWIGASSMFFYEPKNENNPNSPHQTLGINYQEVMLDRAIENFLIENPGQDDRFPYPTAVDAQWYSYTAWLGIGGFKFGWFEFKWADVSFRFVKKAPEVGITETFNNISKDIYIANWTDERYEYQLVSEIQLGLIPKWLDLNIGLLYAKSWDNDNRWRPDDNNRVIMAALIRPQVYITETIHFLLEAVWARERSTIGNRYREHFDSIESNTAGNFNIYGLEWGDTPLKDTFQIKFGPVLNPKGRGIYNRPSIRLLFGAQYTNVHAAFGNSYRESLERRNIWNAPSDLHWHYVISLEAEHWFGAY